MNIKKILIVAAIIILLVVSFFLILKPAYNKNIETAQVEAIGIFVINYMIPQIQQNGYVAIPVGNQTLYLVPVDPTQ